LSYDVWSVREAPMSDLRLLAEFELNLACRVVRRTSAFACVRWRDRAALR
jgi:hypothetical protein